MTSVSTPIPQFWFEAEHRRVVAEVQAVQREFQSFQLSLVGEQLQWEGEVFAPWPQDVVDGSEGLPLALRLRLIYPLGFPAAPIKVMPLHPVIPDHLWGHEWHRWDDGSLCLGRPDLWDISYTARDVIEKATEWWFNFLSYLCKHVDQMPDVGRAVLSSRGPQEEVGSIE